ncbi:MAG TPA: hypothetical protein VNW68_06605 [Candidatus Limnocylindria bacterium]|nr:hypothetical protein [Candidatus Limnocylindria bacterium]
MSVLAERDGLYFVELDCRRCGSHTVAMVTVEIDDAEAAIADLPGLSQPAPPFEHARGGPAITADDVLEMHEFLAGFEGDVDRLFRRAAARWGSGSEGR